MTDRPNDGWIQTYTGGRFYPLKPEISDIRLEDIAHALANTCRYTGHCSDFYSVAQHSVIVSHLVPDHCAQWGLLHDAAEAYISDIARPIKKLPALREYCETEHEIMIFIARKFGLPMHEPDEVKLADNKALSIEVQVLMPQREVEEWTWLPEPPEIYLHPMPPKAAKEHFLRRAHELGVEEC